MAKLTQYISKICCALSFSFLFLSLNAQRSCDLFIISADKDSAFLRSLQLQSSFVDKTSCIQYIHRLPQLLALKGYASSSVDSIREDSASVWIKLFIGNKFTWEKLSISDSANNLLNTLGYHPSEFDHQNFLQQNLEKLYNDVLGHFADNGYPFAKISLDSIFVNGDRISGHLNIQSGPLYHVDTVIVEGNVKISRFFLQQYLQVHDHDVYSQQRLDGINQRLSALNYLQQSQPWQIEMLNTGAQLHLYLQPTKSNSVNLLVGLLPQSDQNSGKLLFTGEATVGLRNSFGTGETLGLNWLQPQPRSPQLNVVYQQPYIFRSPFGLNLDFQLQKQDSAYLNINGQFGVQYELNQHQSGALIIQASSTSVLSVDTNQVKLTGELPPVADVNTTSLGLQYNFYNTDYRFNPRRGNEFFASGIFGNKNVKENSSITQIKDPNFDGGKLYDSVELHSYQFRLQGSAAKFFPLGRQSTIKVAINAGWFQSPDCFQNELFRIGGFKLLRGFDEESIYTNRYSVETAEYRYLLGRNSWFYGFTDLGWAAYNVNDVKFSHTYLGFGVGLSLETNSGIFSISLAEGKRDDTQINFQQAKIHLGFISLF